MATPEPLLQEVPTSEGGRGDEFEVETRVLLGKVPWGVQRLALSATEISVRSSGAPFGSQRLASRSSLSIETSDVAWWAVSVNKADRTQLLQFFSEALMILLCAWQAFGIKPVTSAVCAVCWFLVRAVIWYFSRFTTATLGSPGTPVSMTSCEVPATSAPDVMAAFARSACEATGKSAHATGEFDREWNLYRKECLAIPYGRDKLLLGSHNFQIEQTTGTVGLLFTAAGVGSMEFLAGKDYIGGMLDSVRWTYCNKSGRTTKALLTYWVVSAVIGVCFGVLIGAPSNSVEYDIRAFWDNILKEALPHYSAPIAGILVIATTVRWVLSADAMFEIGVATHGTESDCATFAFSIPHEARHEIRQSIQLRQLGYVPNEQNIASRWTHSGDFREIAVTIGAQVPVLIVVYATFWVVLEANEVSSVRRLAAAAPAVRLPMLPLLTFSLILFAQILTFNYGAKRPLLCCCVLRSSCMLLVLLLPLLTVALSRQPPSAPRPSACCSTCSCGATRCPAFPPP